MSQSQRHTTTCKPKRVMRLLCRNKRIQHVRTHKRNKRYVSIFNTISKCHVKLKSRYLMKHSTKSGIKNHFSSSKCDINLP